MATSRARSEFLGLSDTQDDLESSIGSGEDELSDDDANLWSSDSDDADDLDGAVRTAQDDAGVVVDVIDAPNPQEENPQQSGNATAAEEAPTASNLCDVLKDKRVLIVSLDTEIYNPSRQDGGLASIGAAMAFVDPGKVFSRVFGPLKATFSSLVRPPPNCAPNVHCSRVHNLSMAALREAPTIELVWAELMELVTRQQAAVSADAVLFVAHNGAFVDWSMVDHVSGMGKWPC
jgi:DNA polymerase III epsilon subunit-like protein